MKYFLVLVIFSLSLLAGEIPASPISSNISTFFETLKKDCTDKNLVVRKYQDDFQPHSGESFTFAPSSDSYWLKARLVNDSNETVIRYVYYSDTMVNELDLFYNQQHFKNGLLRSKKDHFLKPTFKLTLPPLSNLPIVLRAHSQSTPIHFQLFLYDHDIFIAKELRSQRVYAFMYGVLLILFVYNLFIFISLKSRAHLYYIMYVAAIGIFLSGNSGMDRQFLFQGEVPWYPYLGSFYLSFLSLSVMMFTRSFLELDKFPSIDRIVKGMLIVVALFPLVMLNKAWYRIDIVVILTVGSMLLTLLLSLQLLFKKHKYIKIYLLGWVPIIFMFLMMASQKFTGFTLADNIPHFDVYALMLEAVIFAIALAIKVKHIDEERHKVKHDLLQFKKDEAEHLKTEVAKKTKEIRFRLQERDSLLRELNHRVKNNMQIIISMLRMQADNYGQEVKDLVTVAENRIRSMLSIHELLYKNEAFIVEAKVYIDQLIAAIINSFTFERNNIAVTIDAEKLSIDKLIQAGFIINELVTNAIKYAVNPEGVMISINLAVVGDKVILEVFDNGEKQPEDHKGEGLGMPFVYTIVEEQLGGELTIDKSQGYRVMISFPL